MVSKVRERKSLDQETWGVEIGAGGAWIDSSCGFPPALLKGFGVRVTDSPAEVGGGVRRWPRGRVPRIHSNLELQSQPETVLDVPSSGASAIDPLHS